MVEKTEGVIRNGQSRETGDVYTRHRRKTTKNQKKHTQQRKLKKKKSNTDPNKNREVNTEAREGLMIQFKKKIKCKDV